MDVADIIAAEFSSFYQSDELPWVQDPGFRTTGLPEMARHSALRMARAAGSESIPDLAATLRAMRADSRHPLVDRVSGATNLMWPDAPEDWIVFQELVDQILANLVSG